MRNQHLQKTRVLVEPDGERWTLDVAHVQGRETFAGEDASRVAGLILPKLNYMAGSPKVVQTAVERIESAGHPEAYLAQLPALVRSWDDPPRGYPRVKPKNRGLLSKLPKDAKLALEMALHEEQERLALAGELVDLELQWQAAEEIAAIADNMFVPKEHEEFIEQHRPRTDAADETSPPE
jgi:hypothetical protein